MSNNEKYTKVFMDTFNLNDEDTVLKLKFQEIPEWDSVGHMDLIANLEDEFDIMFDTDEIIGLNSYDVGKDMLIKHGIEF